MLAGCRVVFSGLFPSNVAPREQAIWRLCERLGASCLGEVDPTVTHVVSVDPGTEKSRWALRHGKFLVNPRWVDGAHYLWRKLPEEDFPVAKPNTPPPPPMND